MSTPFYVAMWESIKHSGIWQGEIWNRRKNGKLYPVAEIFCIRFADPSLLKIMGDGRGETMVEQHCTVSIGDTLPSFHDVCHANPFDIY